MNTPTLDPKFFTQRDNFLGDDGRPYLVRCPACERENYGPAVASGQCAWCGWTPQSPAPAVGYIIDVCDGSAWLTAEGRVTDRWHDRGVWPTPEAAAKAMRGFLSPNTPTGPR